MTNENEKKEENEESLTDSFDSDYEDRKAFAEKQLPLLIQEIKQLDEKLAETERGTTTYIHLRLQRRVAAIAVYLLQSMLLSTSRDVLLATCVDLLAHDMSSPELESRLKKAKDDFDKHVKKRVSQIYDESAHEAMYGAA